MPKRGIVAEDLYRLRYVSDPQVAPNGAWVAFAVTTIDRDGELYRSTIHRMPTAGGTPEPIAEGTHPRWSPDGCKLAYLRERQVWTWESGSDPQQLTNIAGVVTSLAWSPLGNQLAVVANVSLPSAPIGPTEGLHHITRLKYKGDGEGFIYQQRPQLFLVDAQSGEAGPLTKIPYGATSPAWSPDGKKLAFITSQEDPDGSWDRQVMSIPLDGRQPEQICVAIGAQELSWSPDGRWIAFRAAAREYDPSVNFCLWIAPATGGDPINLTASYDRFVGNDRTLCDSMWGRIPQGGVWSADSRTIFFLAADCGEQPICHVSVEGGDVHRVAQGGQPRVVFNFSYCPATGSFVSAGGTPLIPGDLWLLPEGRRLTTVNDNWLSEVELSDPERLEWRSKDGTLVDGWLLKPLDFDPSHRYPAILEIHGGPYRQYGHAFFHELQLFAAQGYLVFYPNPRGSQGYGEDFAHAIHSDWGHHDYDDLMSGMDYLLSFGYVDASRMGVTGGSYGGYMTNWVVTQTDRFAAAVTDRSVSNLYSACGTSDIAFSFFEPIFGTVREPEQVASMLRQSPITHVTNVRTPTLIMHQMEDHACPMEQAEQFYAALKRQGTTTEMLLFPGACHELSRSGPPRLRLQRLQWMQAWFANYLKETYAHV